MSSERHRFQLFREENQVSIGTVRSKHGAKVSGYLNVPGDRAGLPILIPFTIIQGTTKGPVLLVDAATHGNEIEGVSAVVRAIRELDPKRIKGTCILVPAVNIPALREERNSICQAPIKNAGGGFRTLDLSPIMFASREHNLQIMSLALSYGEPGALTRLSYPGLFQPPEWRLLNRFSLILQLFGSTR